MADQQHGPVPDPTSATTRVELTERLLALQLWAGRPPTDAPQALGATGWVEAQVVACLRARQWPADAIDRELERWRSAIETIVAEPPTAEYPVVAPAVTGDPVPTAGRDDDTQEFRLRASGAGLDDPTAVHAVPAVPAVPGPPPEPPTPRWRRATGRRVAVLAGLVVLVLIAVPAIAIRVVGSSTPAASALPTDGAAESVAATDTADGHESRAGGEADPQAMRASTPSPTAPPADPGEDPEPPPPPAEPDDDDEQRDDEPSSGGPWSTIVDNTTQGRFSASGNWSTSSDAGQHYGSNYRYASPVEASDPAWYRVDIPETGRYRVDVWFPTASNHNDRTPYIVATTDGNQTIHVSQQSSGGRWVTLGTFTIAGGDADVVAVSRWRTAGTGRVIADAVRITEA